LSQGEFPIKKVVPHAKPGHESLRNYKLLQQFFSAKGITRSIDIERLTNAKPMDNLEFLQWMKSFYESMRPMSADSALKTPLAGTLAITCIALCLILSPKTKSLLKESWCAISL
jgi:hypothetical protein